MNEAAKFLQVIADVDERLGKVVRDEMAHWHPDLPPIIVIFGYVGGEIELIFDSLSHADRTSLFALIEAGMQSADEDVAEAVATGLVESLVTGREAWGKLAPYCGPATRAHVGGWTTFECEPHNR